MSQAFFGNRVLTSLFGPKTRSIREWIGLFNIIYTYRHIIRMIKSGRMSWSERVGRLREKTNGYKVLVGKIE
jgi:hypothetical protein